MKMSFTIIKKQPCTSPEPMAGRFFRACKATYCLCRIPLGEPCEIMPRAKASHCLRRISQGEPRDPLPLRHSECRSSRRESAQTSPPRRNNERTDVRCYDFGMGSATVPVAVFGVAPKTLQPTHLSNDGSGATPEPARGTHALPPIVHTKMKTGKEPFQCGMRNAECGERPSSLPSSLRYDAATKEPFCRPSRDFYI